MNPSLKFLVLCLVLYCIILYYITLHYITLHYIILYCIVLYCIVLYTVLYYIVLCCIVVFCIGKHIEECERYLRKSYLRVEYFPSSSSIVASSTKIAFFIININIILQFPCAFEFNENFLITILDHLYR